MRDTRVEFELIRAIRAGLPARDPSGRVLVGPGDDAAVVRRDDAWSTVMTVDALVAGRHFEIGRSDPAQLGRRLAAVNLSDIAAMGAIPEHGLLSIAAPPDLARTWVPGVADGVAQLLASHGAALVGGNLASIDGPLVVDLTLVGRVEAGCALLRSGARPGDAILVTGRLGAAAAGLAAARRGEPVLVMRATPVVRAYLEPAPRVAAGRVASRDAAVRAAIDVSDGFVADLGHVGEASGLAATVELDALPIDETTRAIAGRMGLDPGALATVGGDDYELILCCEPSEAERVAGDIERETGVPVAIVGTMVEGRSGDVTVVDAEGRRYVPPTGGYDHFDPDASHRPAGEADGEGSEEGER